MEVVDSERDRRLVGLINDDDIKCSLDTPDGDLHPNHTRMIWRCVVLDAKEAEDKHILPIHTQNHVNVIKNISSKQLDPQKNGMASKLSSAYINELSSETAYLAAGYVTEDEPCDICGDVGFSGSISICFNCRMAREHIYCMRVLLKEVPKMWFCESCRSSTGIISPTLAAKELLPMDLAANSSNMVKSGTLQTVGPSKPYKDPRQSAHLVNDLFPVSLSSKSTRIVKDGIAQHVDPSKLYKDLGAPAHLMKQMAVETADVKFKPFEEADKLSLESKQALQSNRGLTSIRKKTVMIKTGPTKFSLMKVEENPSFLIAQVKTRGYGSAMIDSITQQAPQTSAEFKGD